MFRFVLTFISVFLAVKIVGVFHSGWIALTVFSVILTIVNLTIKPIITILTWPINFLTLGLFRFCLNAVFLELISYVTPGFYFANIWETLIFVLVLHALEWFLYRVEINRY
jgi:putative membrane protein